MLAVTYQAPGEVRVEERPEPELLGPRRRRRADRGAPASAARTCTSTTAGSDRAGLHARPRVRRRGHRGRRRRDRGGRRRPRAGQLLLGVRPLLLLPRRRLPQVRRGRVFGHGKTLGALQGAQAEQALVPHANLDAAPPARRACRPTSRCSPATLWAPAATPRPAASARATRSSCSASVPSGSAPSRRREAAGAAKVIAIDSVADRLAHRRPFGAQPVHLTEDDPRAAVRPPPTGRGADAAIDAVGHPQVLETRSA